MLHQIFDKYQWLFFIILALTSEAYVMSNEIKKAEGITIVLLLREKWSDQVVFWASVINNLSQIQPGMTRKLTCSSFHTPSTDLLSEHRINTGPLQK